eukprot:TRINITY_DN779898_c0_g1_i1.p1 TRINITY_DN779898_c0_g1~~TRINITY_DN779898_c0_g1_i1.p1  ORF type:complete len:414 (-),score=85.34 TRINITY_DN779898_c0_g1_i1:71-1312(-)
MNPHFSTTLGKRPIRPDKYNTVDNRSREFSEQWPQANRPTTAVTPISTRTRTIRAGLNHSKSEVQFPNANPLPNFAGTMNTKSRRELLKLRKQALGEERSQTLASRTRPDTCPNFTHRSNPVEHMNNVHLKMVGSTTRSNMMKDRRKQTAVEAKRFMPKKMFGMVARPRIEENKLNETIKRQEERAVEDLKPKFKDPFKERTQSLSVIVNKRRGYASKITNIPSALGHLPSGHRITKKRWTELIIGFDQTSPNKEIAELRDRADEQRKMYSSFSADGVFRDTIMAKSPKKRTASRAFRAEPVSAPSPPITNMHSYLSTSLNGSSILNSKSPFPSHQGGAPSRSILSRQSSRNSILRSPVNGSSTLAKSSKRTTFAMNPSPTPMSFAGSSTLETPQEYSISQRAMVRTGGFQLI